MKETSPEAGTRGYDNRRPYFINGTSTYEEALERLRGNPEIRLTREREQELAQIIATRRNQLEADPSLVFQLRDAGNNTNRMTVCIRALPEGDETRWALNVLVKSDLRSALNLAKASMKWVLGSSRPVLDDRIQVVNFALIEAAWNFAPGVENENGEITRFTAFAGSHTYKRLRRYVLGSEESPAISYTDSMKESTTKSRQQMAKLWATRRAEIVNFWALENPELLTLDAKVEAPPSAESALHDRARLRIALDSLLKTAGLTDRERDILQRRFGLKKGRPHTYDEIGALYDRTGARILQIEKATLRKLRQYADAAELGAFLHTSE